MAEKLTPQQEQAVNNRGGKLLVSAAAGSGKTKVLVDRLMSYVLHPTDPANLDDFLIITYTKAAAAELRGKIAAKLTEHLAAQPENRHLQRQMQRLYLAKISTVHSFCGDILREYAYKLDLAPDFRVADENECAQLRDTCMSQMLDEAYENAESDEDFRAFVDSQGLGRDDRLVPKILLKVFDSAQCHLDPEGWLDECVRNVQITGLTDASQTLWGAYLIEDLKSYLSLQIQAMEICARAADQAEGMEKPALLLHSEIQQLQQLYQCTTWDQIVDAKQIEYGTLRFGKAVTDLDLVERIKAVRNGCKKGLAKKLTSFADKSSQIFADMAHSAEAARGMVSLVRRFSQQYQKAKRSRRMLDFGDLEHKTLELLFGSSRSGPTAVARELGERFREIMVDEYQDSNAVQDKIFEALTVKRSNCFMVGDVKQSIYQFRLADPNIFLKKYAEYVPADLAEPGQGRKVVLSSNFRSGGAVLEGVNDIFRCCMTEKVGGLTYGADEALYEGIPHAPVGEPEVELLTLSTEEGVYEAEAKMVAQRILQLLDGTHFVRKKDGLRPIVPEDIAILLRSPGSAGGYYRDALAGCGIRSVSGGGENLLETGEISVLRSLLQTISNPRQDIPLVAVLASPVFGFTADDLAAIRGKHPFGSIYDALVASEKPMVKAFLDTLAYLRREARLEPLAVLIQKIFALTRMDSIYAAMDGGDAKVANLQTFYNLAVSFESGSRRDLEQFLEYLASREEDGLIAAGEQTAPGAVTIMSIHKSKGLEFPVVFVSSLSRGFNRESLRAQVLCDQDLGLGLSAVDEKNRVRYPTVAKKAIAVKMTADSLSEEMRVLYVALTRAKDRLIMTYASKKLEDDLKNLALRMDMGDRELLTRDVSCPGQWVLMAALRRTEAGELFKLGGYPLNTSPGTPPWKICVMGDTSEAAASGIAEETVPKPLPQEALTAVQRGLAFRYPYTAATQAPSKQTATQRKGRDKDAEAAENTQEPAVIYRRWRKGVFGGMKADGVDAGNAIHAVMQYICYSACDSLTGVREEIRRLVNQRFITDEQAQLVDETAIADFFKTELGQKLRLSPNVLREFKFSILDNGENFSPSLQGEKILLQGVVDCALIEDDGITVVDFKTDKVTESTLQERAEQYRPQVLAYADALSRIYQKPIKQTLLYFFHIGQFVSMA
ncbi:MAG: helicase-exonuclease AddAB subunit AddA [Ruminococcaceae bacterium]|nr:helicase-exonuclease AddAB subunit AddA [Oscillospiraceae bacterium]